MTCPRCYCETIIIRTWALRRERLCLGCGAILTTIERLLEVGEPEQYSFLLCGVSEEGREREQ